MILRGKTNKGSSQPWQPAVTAALPRGWGSRDGEDMAVLPRGWRSHDGEDMAAMAALLNGWRSRDGEEEQG